jgi:hypothetical protein
MSQIRGNIMVVRSQRLAGWFLLHGQPLKGIDVNREDVNKQIFLFANNLFLERLIEEYKQYKAKNNNI